MPARGLVALQQAVKGPSNGVCSGSCGAMEGRPRMAGQPSTPEVAERGQGRGFVQESDIGRCHSINSSARGRNDSGMVRGAAFSGQDEGVRQCSLAAIFGPHPRFVGYPTPCFRDRVKLTDLVYRAVSPLGLDIPMRHVGRFYLARLEHRPRILGQNSRHTTSPC
jgi:hypothetical protein